MMRIALGVEYDGSAYRGWQTQRPGVRTVQPVLERALARVANAPVRLSCAGRTDAGVHAMQQVVHFDTAAARAGRAWVLGGNANLPPDCSVLWARRVDETFHARFSALARGYRYLILDRTARAALHRDHVAWCHRPLDAGRMHQAGQALVGEHDFSAFRAVACQARHPMRRVHRLAVGRAHGLVVIEVEANAFLHHMVRNIAGVLMAIGTGERPVAWAHQVLAGRDRTRGGVTAPASGLYLVAVRYPERYALPEPPALAAIPGP